MWWRELQDDMEYFQPDGTLRAVMEHFEPMEHSERDGALRA
jgi:hypothetical protein